MGAIADAVASGDRKSVLEALRTQVAEALDAGPAARDLKPLVAELRAIEAELADLTGPKEGSAASAIAARRAGPRRPNPSDRRSTAGGVQ